MLRTANVVKLALLHNLGRLPEPERTRANHHEAEDDQPRRVPNGHAFEQVNCLAFRLLNRSSGEIADEDLGRVAHARSDDDATLVGVQLLAPPHRETTPVLIGKLEGT
ncbi:MAG: hypothetical protein ACHRXM_04525 [Isosphaerales bacterium]